MFVYYLKLALRSFQRNRILTTLMVLAIALGIGTSMTTLTVFHVLSGDPIPGKSERLFYPQMDPRPLAGYRPGDEPALQLTRLDAETLLREKRGKRQALMSGGGLAIEPEAANMPPFTARARYTSTDFFPMFEVPFARGRPWTTADDEARARVAVISQSLADKLYGAADPVGRMLKVNGTGLRIVGVLDDWNPNPRFYDMTNRQYGDVEEVFVPFSTSRDLRLGTSGNIDCWGDSDPDDPEGNYGLHAGCSWIQYWVELDSSAQAADYRNYLANYVAQQHASGRFQRPANIALYDVMGWMDHNQVVPSDVRLQLWLALGFLGICLLNTVGLMLAKFLRRSGEIGVRRALGAARRDILFQCLVEASVIGLAGGILGLALAWIGLWLVRRQPTDYGALVHMDLSMLGTTFVLAIASSLAAGLLPALRAMQIAPVLQLKSQ
ncbi:ABC transporter permease [[Pseudomonas] boreopolis]|uniref:ABC transporter ATP-binding protein n=1 Tax=Xanthomonas boreopolis TaxID=86183 RepID=A0A919F9W3_9XANT|nr:ABC transporter ATP-binding protein [[Pseudomonas] boreopolis]